MESVQIEVSGGDASIRESLSVKTPLFRVKGIPVYGDAILAPMDGYSEWPYRSLCAELGSAMSYTEFVKAKNIIRAYKHMAPRLIFDEVERPMVFQLWSENPDELLQAALMVQDKSPDIIDVNMGCPAKSVANIGAGVGLMRTPLKIARIFRKLSSALEVPVTGKIRLGWDDCRSYKLVARILEENGAALIAVHGRTKEQGYGGEADWDAIAEIKSLVKIPVIGNGDIRSVADIERMKSYTGCDAVMIGRSAIGNPWIFSRLERDQVPPEEVRRMMHLHLERNMAFHGPHKGLVLFRKHALRYLKLQRLPRATRTVIFTQDSPERFMAMLDEAFTELEKEESGQVKERSE
jgi:tRNA-dihydrouridine synthase B